MRLGILLRKFRVMSDLTIRDLAREIGVSSAVLSRIERGENCDSRTLMRILNWLTEEPAAPTPQEQEPPIELSSSTASMFDAREGGL